jgi:hypothetical protein
MSAPTLRQWFLAYIEADRLEMEAFVARVAHSTRETRRAHRAASVAKGRVRMRFEQALREADERGAARCRRMHVEDRGVFAIDLRPEHAA